MAAEGQRSGERMALSRMSEYFSNLTAGARKRYEVKVTSTGLSIDPYCIDESEWSREPEIVPELCRSDVMLYMVSTPSPIQRKVSK